MAKKEQKNSPEVEHRLSVIDVDKDAQAEHRAAIRSAHDDNVAQAEAVRDRALALAAPIQKVTDGNETAALASITGQVPVRDVSDAPPPNELGPHDPESDDPAAKRVEDTLDASAKDAKA